MHTDSKILPKIVRLLPVDCSLKLSHMSPQTRDATCSNVTWNEQFVANVCSNKDKLLVYRHPDDAEDDSSYELAAIVPPGGNDSLPFLFRVPNSAIAVERVTLASSAVGQSSGFKRLSLRSDCELARRVEDLLTPFKKQRVHSNLVYTPPDSDHTEDALDVNETTEDALGVQGNTELSAAVDVEMSRSFSDSTIRLSPAVGVTASGEKAASSLALGVPVHSVNSLIEPVEAQPDVHMAGSRSGDEAAVNPCLNADVVDDLPAGAMDEECPATAVYGLRGGHAHGSPISAADRSSPRSSQPYGGVEAHGTIAVPHAPDNQLARLGAHTDVPGNNSADTDTSRPSVQENHVNDNTGQAEVSPCQPAVRLLAVQPNGIPLSTQAPASETHFFRLDVRMEDAKQVMDVEAMTKVEEHSSLEQLKEHHDYTLEDCIAVCTCLTVTAIVSLTSTPSEGPGCDRGCAVLRVARNCTSTPCLAQ